MCKYVLVVVLNYITPMQYLLKGVWHHAQCNSIVYNNTARSEYKPYIVYGNIRRTTL
jgi:hypothetical protein